MSPKPACINNAHIQRYLHYLQVSQENIMGQINRDDGGTHVYHRSMHVHMCVYAHCTGVVYYSKERALKAGRNSTGEIIEVFVFC